MELDDNALTFLSQTWSDVLEPIPTRWLNDSFKLAAQDGERITPALVLKAWGRLAESGKVQMLTSGEMKDCPHRCSSGWVVKIEGTKEGVIRCPLHSNR